MKNFSEAIKNVLGNRVFLRYTSITTILFTGLSSWVSSSEHIVSEIYKQPQLFAWIFAGIGLWMAISTLTNSRLSYKFGARQTLRWLLISYTIVATLLLLSTFLFGDPPQIVLFVVAVAMLLGINLAIEPNSSALAMEPMGNVAGVASSIYGTVFFFVGAGLGSIISVLMTETVFPLIVSFFLIGIVCLTLAFADRRQPVTS